MSAGVAAPVSEDVKALLEKAAADATVVKPDYMLAEMTTMRAGGRADFFAEPKSEAGLSALEGTTGDGAWARIEFSPT